MTHVDTFKAQLYGGPLDGLQLDLPSEARGLLLTMGRCAFPARGELQPNQDPEETVYPAVYDFDGLFRMPDGTLVICLGFVAALV